jgi:formylmethanofuran dehydrogenase subunit C
MSALSLTLKQKPASGVDLSPLTPDRLQGKKFNEIKELQLDAGKSPVRAGDLFEITGSDPQHLIFKRATDKLHHIGAGMTQGLIEISGTAGDYLGREMRGGAIKLRGSAGHWVGAGMREGEIQISGNTGDFLGAALPGQREGMRGGLIVVAGNAGDRVGDRQRKGVIVIKGDAGSYCGSQMLAGTIICLGKAGANPGTGMKRGTLVFAQNPAHLSPSFNTCGPLKMEFLRLLFKQMSFASPQLTMLRQFGPLAERLVGDMASGGKGEILILQGNYGQV